MLGAALTRLLLDLERIEEGRSPYEEALILELRVLAQTGTSSGLGNIEGVGVRPIQELDIKGLVAGEGLSRHAGTIRNVPERFDLSVDLSPTDTVRLNCSNKNCPNKRR